MVCAAYIVRSSENKDISIDLLRVFTVNTATNVILLLSTDTHTNIYILVYIYIYTRGVYANEIATTTTTTANDISGSF